MGSQILKCVFFIAILVTLVTGLLTYDFYPLNDSDLEIPTRSIDPNRNPYPEIRKTKFTASQNEILKRYKTKEEKQGLPSSGELSSLLSEFKAELALIDKYSKMDEWRFNLPIKLGNSFPELETFPKLFFIKHGEITEYFDVGRKKDAIENALVIMRFGSNLTKSEAGITHYIYGYKICCNAQEILLKMLDRHELTIEELLYLHAELGKCDIDSLDLINSLKIEYQRGRRFLKQMKNEGWDPVQVVNDLNGRDSGLENHPRSLFKINRTKKRLASTYRKLITTVSTSSTEYKNGISTNVLTVSQDKSKMWIGANPLARIFHQPSEM